MKAQRIRVYWNSHRGCYSIQTKLDDGWRVTNYHDGHKSYLYLENVLFYVGQKGRNRVLRTKHKNVHAWIEGDYKGLTSVDIPPSWTWVNYNPYKNQFFVTADGDTVVTRPQALLCCLDKPYIYVEA